MRIRICDHDGNTVYDTEAAGAIIDYFVPRHEEPGNTVHLPDDAALLITLADEPGRDGERRILHVGDAAESTERRGP